MADAQQVSIWNRREGRAEREQIYGDALVRGIYGNRFGRLLGDLFFSHPALSKLAGLYQSSPLSRFKIASFVRDFAVPMHEFEPGPFRSFNDFFVRRFRPGARSFAPDPDILAAFAEGRYLAYERVGPQVTFPVKGEYLSADAILGGDDRARRFRDGPVLVARLCPVDYHRFHYPDDGRTAESYALPGRLHSVNPIALRERPDVFTTNERHVGLLESSHFGALAYVEVGAMMVGRIVQTHPVDQPFRRGDEKGYFLFGASTVILFGEAGRWRPDDDLLGQTEQRRETLVRLGESVGRLC